MEYDLKARFYDLRLNVNRVNDIVFTMPRDPVMQLVWIGYKNEAKTNPDFESKL